VTPGVQGGFPVRRISRIAVAHRKVQHEAKVGPQQFPGGLQVNHLVEKRQKIVGLGEFASRLAQTRLQVLLGALLRMETRRAIAGVLSGAQLAFEDGEVFFGLGHPLGGHRSHRAPCPSAECRA